MPKLLPTFSTSYRCREITVEFLHHPKGITIRIQIDGGYWLYDADHFWTSYEDAHAAALALGRLYIDRMSANDQSY